IMGLVSRVDASGMHPCLARSKILIACDVRNVLLGPEGAARIFSPQKGADAAAVRLLEKNLSRVIGRIERAAGRTVRNIPGAGAAGGAAAGLLAFTPGTLKSGIGIVLDAVRFKSRIRDADWIFTGEGRVDSQTVYGKAVSGIAATAASLCVPVIVIAGSVGPGSDALLKKGATAIFSLCPGPADLNQAMDRAGPWLKAAAFQIMRTVTAASPGRSENDRRRSGRAPCTRRGFEDRIRI
ncbi:glycerate kinase, partial [bacterium]|nr:glycerate kinase [bacterium]